MGSLEQEYKKLYTLQDRVLESIFQTEDIFYLTGGTCISRFYQEKRYSNNSSRYSFAIKKIKQALQKDFQITSEVETKDFSRFKIDNILQVDFVNDISYRYKDIVITKENYIIDNIENILSNKIAAGEGAFKEVLSVQSSELRALNLPLKSNKSVEKDLVIVASKSHLSEETQCFVDDLALKTEHLTLFSKESSLKICLIAEGETDIYPRLAPTMDWDTAADAIIREARKETIQFDSDEPVVYNKENLLNPWFLVR